MRAAWLQDVFEGIDEFADHEGMSLHLVELVGREVVDLRAEVGGQLTEVLFGHHHVAVLAQHAGRVLG